MLDSGIMNRASLTVNSSSWFIQKTQKRYVGSRSPIKLHNSGKTNIVEYQGLLNPLEKTFADTKEVDFHSKLADKWWNSDNVLIKFNEVRVPFICNAIGQTGLFKSTNFSDRHLEGHKILDVGCGGGILTEALGYLKANVTGIDPSSELINVARAHLSKSFVGNNVNYEKAEICEYSQRYPEEFDTVILSEVIEHVADKERFLSHSLRCLKPKGNLVITTPNISFISDLFLIFLGERLGLVPPGTHDRKKFISPKMLSQILIDLNCTVVSKQGFGYSVVQKKFINRNSDKLMYGINAIKN